MLKLSNIYIAAEYGFKHLFLGYFWQSFASYVFEGISYTVTVDWKWRHLAERPQEKHYLQYSFQKVDLC